MRRNTHESIVLYFLIFERKVLDFSCLSNVECDNKDFSSQMELYYNIKIVKQSGLIIWIQTSILGCLASELVS